MHKITNQYILGKMEFEEVEESMYLGIRVMSKADKENEPDVRLRNKTGILE